MSEQKDSTSAMPDPIEFSQNMAKIAERSQRIVTDFLTRQTDSGQLGMADPLNIGNAFLEMTARMMAQPSLIVEAQVDLWRNYMTLWHSTARRFLGQEEAPLHTAARGDRRFRDPAWDESFVFDYIKQSYLMTAKWLQTTVNKVEGLDPTTARKVDFYTRQFADAMAPSNFILTNPEVLKATLDSRGENLINGLENLIDDLEQSDGQFRIKMVDRDAFEVGGNIATSPGKVVYQNELMQLIQYAPTTEQAYRRPLLIVPPWINKFYILDLRPKNSFIRWAVSQGLTVFVVSWVNPGEDLAGKTFDSYMLDGPIAALDAIGEATGEREVNVIGYCIGGTLMAATLAYLAEKGDDRVRSATFFTTMIDFEEPGELGVFIDEEQLQALEDRMSREGYLEGGAMATTFNMLRANDLIWSFVVNNYLLGKEPFPFDLLYWNADSTRMPSAMHSFYLRKMYQENRLKEPGGITLDGVAIDLRKVQVPVCVVSTREDHIAPWKSTYAATQIYGGPVKFILAGSGHIAGIVNPPESGKYGYWTSTRKVKDPEKWLDGAKHAEGSWWPEWARWIVRHGGGKVAARDPAAGGLPAIEDAPGSYVRARAA